MIKLFTRATSATMKDTSSHSKPEEEDFDDKNMMHNMSEGVMCTELNLQGADGAANSTNDLDLSTSQHSFRLIHTNANRNERFARWSLFGMVTLGTLAATLFTTIGIHDATEDQQKSFDRSASEFVNELQTAFHDYKTAGLWVQAEVSRSIKGASKRTTSQNASNTAAADDYYFFDADFENDLRSDFRSLYEDLISSGLDFQATSFNPNVSSWEVRQRLEDNARTWYSENYPELEPYAGFRGLEPNEDGTEWTVQSRSEQSQYFPVHYIEPIQGNEGAIDFDLYSSSSRRKTIHRAIESFEPAVTPRLQLVQETDPSAYSVILMHPGIPHGTVNHTIVIEPPPASFSSMVIRIPDLLDRAFSRISVDKTLSIYIYDNFIEHLDDRSQQFLGAARTPSEEIMKKGLEPLPEIDLNTCRSHFESQLVFEERISIVSNQTWLVIVTAPDQAFQQGNQLMIVAAGGFLLILCVFIGVLLFGTFRRIHRQNLIKTQASRERAEWMVETAKKAARSERELNDFIAHEVRNPLAAAISACSFVSSAIESQPLLPDENGVDQKTPIQEDVDIIDSSLHFINDLLRNMLDIHRAHSKQLTIDKKPTHILNDVLRPVDTLLHRRGTGIRVEVECSPPDLVGMTDSLRLKQIISNLARNAFKFVDANPHQQGLIRIRAATDNKMGYVQLFVEDNGPGIPPEKRANLFGRFQESLDSLHQGTGIGLSLCKKLVDLMGGMIYIDEHYDSGCPGWPGTRFVVDLMRLPMLDEDDYWFQAYNNRSAFSSIRSEESSSVPHHPSMIQQASDIEMGKATKSSTTNNPSNRRGTDSLDSHTLSTSAESTTENPPVESSCWADNNNSSNNNKEPITIRSKLPENLRVLFVDDDTIVRKLFLRCVKKVAPTWKVHEASNGETALRMVLELDNNNNNNKNNEAGGDVGDDDDDSTTTSTSTSGIDLIFMDQYMASVQKQLLGTETTVALRSRGVTCRICGLSANDMAASFEEAGADSFLFKPFPCKPDQLTKELLRILQTRRFKQEQEQQQ